MTTRKRYSDRLKAWSAQIADLQAKARSAGGEQQPRIGRQVDTLQRQRTEYAQQMWRIRDTRAAVFRNMQKSAEQMAAGFRKSYM